MKTLMRRLGLLSALIGTAAATRGESTLDFVLAGGMVAFGVTFFVTEEEE